ncbi:lipocalin-like domain-containing protein [Mesorhizobium waimense]|nr:lipocalin-like domain-containing protein [Mesorhizobium waimense]
MATVAGMSGQGAADIETIGRLAGAWRLAAIELPQMDRTTRETNAVGLLVLTVDGHMAIQVRNLDASVADNAYSSGGYEATYGTIMLDPVSSTFVYHVDGALVQDLVGQDLPRAYRVVDDQLILTSTRDEETWRVVWRRAQQNGQSADEAVEERAS